MQVVEVKNKSLDVDRAAMLDTSIDQVIYRRYQSDTTINTNTTDIVISVRDVNEYFSLKRSYIEVRGKFASIADSSALSAVGAKVALECGATSLFSQSRLRIQNQLVEDNQSLSHVNAHIKTLTTQSKEYNETIGRAHGFALDDFAGVDENQNNRYSSFNEGFLRRRLDAGANVNSDYSATTPVEKSYTIPMSSLFSCCDVDKVFKGVSLKVELSLRSALARMFGSSELDTFHVSNCDLLLGIVQPSFEVLGELEQRFAGTEPISYVYNNFKTYESPVVAAPTSMNYTFNVQHQKPLGVFVALQKTAGSKANWHNEMMFDRCKVSQLKVKVNGKIMPYEPYQPNFSSGEWMRIYEELSRFGDRYLDKSSSLALTPEQWYETSTIYYIDFSNLAEASSYQISVETSHSSAPTSLTVGSEANSRSSSVKIYLTTVSIGELEVNPNRGMTTVKLV